MWPWANFEPTALPFEGGDHHRVCCCLGGGYKSVNGGGARGSNSRFRLNKAPFRLFSRCLAGFGPLGLVWPEKKVLATKKVAAVVCVDKHRPKEHFRPACRILCNTNTGSRTVRYTLRICNINTGTRTARVSITKFTHMHFYRRIQTYIHYSRRITGYYVIYRTSLVNTCTCAHIKTTD